VEAVRKWKFAPATKNGHPVPVSVEIDVQFRLF
jgi:outer membrane biosynthesis protein TonB